MHNPKEGAVGGLGLVEVRVLPVLLDQLEQHAGICALGRGRGGVGEGRVGQSKIEHQWYPKVTADLGNEHPSSHDSHMTVT